MGEGVTFWMPPMEEETEITGPMSSKLFVSSSTEDADLFIIVRVFDPDGKELTFMAQPTRTRRLPTAGCASRTAP